MNQQKIVEISVILTNEKKVLIQNRRKHSMAALATTVKQEKRKEAMNALAITPKIMNMEKNLVIINQIQNPTNFDVSGNLKSDVAQNLEINLIKPLNNSIETEYLTELHKLQKHITDKAPLSLDQILKGGPNPINMNTDCGGTKCLGVLKKIQNDLNFVEPAEFGKLPEPAFGEKNNLAQLMKSLDIYFTANPFIAGGSRKHKTHETYDLLYW